MPSSLSLLNFPIVADKDRKFIKIFSYREQCFYANLVEQVLMFAN